MISKFGMVETLEDNLALSPTVLLLEDGKRVGIRFSLRSLSNQTYGSMILFDKETGVFKVMFYLNLFKTEI